MSLNADWHRRRPFVELTPSDATTLIGELVVALEPLRRGRRNTNYRVTLAAQSEPLVLRIYSFDASAAEREPAVLRLVPDSVPAPRVVRAEPGAKPPWSLMTFMQGERCERYLRQVSPEEVGTVAFSAGEALAALHAISFAKSGYFEADLNIVPPPWPDISWAEMLIGWLRGRAGARLGDVLSRRLLEFVQRHADEVPRFNAEARFVHNDFQPANLLAHDGRITAVLDWEGAYSGLRLGDLSIFLRHSASLPPTYLSGFIDGYTHGGGDLPDDWYRLTRLNDLVNLVYFIERPEDARPEDDPAVLNGVVPLIETTLRAFVP